MRVVPKYPPRTTKQASAANQTARPSQAAQLYRFPAPIRGIIENENIATPAPAGAQILDNWFCTPTGIKMRKGSQKVATVAEDAPVKAMFTYTGQGTEFLFAATETDIFDVTDLVDPETIPTAVVTGQTGGYYSTTPFQTAGGYFLVIANGQNAVRNFDGAAWTTPTISGVASADLSAVWSFASRLFFVEKNSLFAWYLPVDSIAGTANSINLGGIFRRGGSLLFGASWSVDSGAGFDDRCVFVSDQGEVVVFDGKDPASASDWRVVGVYQIGRPLGKNAWFTAGGDLVIATENGLVPLSEAVKKDPAALGLSSVSRQIAPSWQREVLRRRSLPWNVIKWTAGNLLFVALPRPVDSLEKHAYVASMETGSWSRFVGWDMRSVAVFRDELYFGTNAGTVHQANVNGWDDGAPYTAVAVYLFDPMGVPGVTKTLHQIRATFLATTAIVGNLGSWVDYRKTGLLAPAPSPADATALWDVALWDVSFWDGRAAASINAQWTSFRNTGFVVAPHIQITSASELPFDVEFVSADVTYTAGALVT